MEIEVDNSDQILQDILNESENVYTDGESNIISQNQAPNIEEFNTEEINLDEANANKLNTEDVNIEDINTEEINSEDINTNVDADQFTSVIASEEFNGEEPMMEHRDSLVESNTELAINSESKLNKATSDCNRLVRLPLARVKHIMKMDPECTLVSADAVIVATKAVEMFLSYLGSESVRFTLNNKRKTVLRRDLDNVVENEARLCFLDGALD